MNMNIELTQGVEVLVAGQIIPNDVVGLPATKQWEARTNLHLHRVIEDLQVRGGDVSDLISVVDVLRRRRKNSLLKAEGRISIDRTERTRHTEALS